MQEISIAHQWELIGLPRSSYYYTPAQEDAYNLQLMNLMDEEFTRDPSYGSRRLTAWLRRQGHQVNRKRVGRLMRKMGLEAIYPKPKKTSEGNKEHKKYPYLLKNLAIDRPNFVWCSDITYVRMKGGFIYLTVVMDWYSRYVISWEISNTLEVYFCIDALQKALASGQPKIFNSDQGSQYTSPQFTDILHSREVRISMAGKGRCFDNIFVERLWRSFKYEEVYTKDYETVPEAIAEIGKYFRRYNTERLHQSLGYRTLQEVDFS